jgi:threonine/homoserine/homoserine lactone efflux protein
MYEGLPGLALTSLLIELSPGPNMAYLALIAATDGRRPGFAAVAGVALGLALMGAAAALGLAGLIGDQGPLYQALKWAGAAYLLWLAWQGWRGADGEVEHAAIGSSLPMFFRRGLITNLLNPKAAVFYITVLPGFLTDGPDLAEPLTLSAVFVAVATGVHLGVVVAAGAAHDWITTPARAAPLRRVLALALVAVAVWIALKP